MMHRYFFLLPTLLITSACAAESPYGLKTLKPEAQKTAEKPHVSWHCKVSEAAQASVNSAFLNKKLPDKTEWLRTTIDLTGKCNYGVETFGHKAIDFEATFRHKAYWGVDGIKTEKESVSVGNVALGEHSHPVSKPALWLSSASIDISLDALAGKIKSQGLNKIKIGYFPFELGRGISLGSTYGISQDFLGIYLKANDFYVPGVLLHGSLPNNTVDYQFYFARPDSQSASIKQTLAISREHRVNSSLPFGGTMQDDGILAAQFTIKPKMKNEKHTLAIKPYGMVYWGMNKKVNMTSDSEVSLFTLGCSTEAKANKWEFGGETAINFGQQEVFKSDLNALKLQTNKSRGTLEEVFSHITDASINENAIATDVLKAELAANLHRDLAPFTTSDSGQYASKAGRLTTPYINTYKGSMGVFDATFSSDFGPKISFAAGFATGGANPHDILPGETTKRDSHHGGFVGISETYSGKRVPSMIVLGGGNVKRPLALTGKTSKLKDFIEGAFTDITFIGTGLTAKPDRWKDKKIDLGCNALVFFKDHIHNKIVINNDVASLSTTDEASRFLGAEVNGTATIEPITGLTITLKTAIFLPGTYYEDIKGATLSEDIIGKLKKHDLDKINSTAYRIGSDACYYASFDIKYIF